MARPGTLVLVLVLLLGVVAVGVVMAVHVYGAHRDLRTAAAAVPVLWEKVTDGDVEAAQESAARVGEDASPPPAGPSFQLHTSSPTGTSPSSTDAGRQ